MSGRLRWALAVFTAVLLSGCAANLENVPLPAPEARGASYALTAVFSDALNLPTKAKVKLFGADIGQVDAIDAQDFTAHVRMRISADVPLRVGSTAELRSATLLGDTFVQIRPAPEHSAQARVLRDGDTIPLTATAAAPTIEELLNSMALLVNGGTVRYLISVLNGAGTAVGGRGEKTAALTQELRTLLATLTNRSDQLDAALQQTSDLAATLAARKETLESALGASGPAMAVIAEDANRTADLTDSVARITRQLARFPSVQGTDTRSTTADLNRLAGVFNDITVDPNLSLNEFNRMLGLLMKSTNSTAAHSAGAIEQLALVPWPDMNYPGDPGFHWPDGTDWHGMVGSLRYQWNMVLGRIYGPHR